MLAVNKVFGEFLYPLNTWVALSLVAIILCLWKPRHPAGIALMLVGTVWLVVASVPATGLLLLRFIENGAGVPPDLHEKGCRGIRYVVVLGNVTEGTKLWSRIPGGTLVISSGSLTELMVQEARAMGVPDGAIVAESQGRNTEEQAQNLKALLGRARFFVSTWALHMPRTLLTFRRQGLDPVPAPTDFLSHSTISVESFWPSASGMSLTRLALHELAGSLWLLVRSPFERSEAPSLKDS